jgi:hypothetical protein
MKISAERLLRLRWLLLSAVSAGACGGSVDATHNGPGSSSGGSGTSGPETPTTPTAAGRGGSSNVAGAGGSSNAAGGSSNVAGAGGTRAGGGTTSTVAGGTGTVVIGGGGVASGGAETVPHGECLDPKPTPSGFVTCSNGLTHRETKLACENNLPATQDCGYAPNTFVCDGTKLEYCDPQSGGQAPPTSCAVGCTSDDACVAGQICVCGPQTGVCVSASCTVDADCGDGYLCRAVKIEHGQGCPAMISYQCELPDDACASASDCGADARCQPAVAGGPLHCEPIEGFACGRPFLVNGAARVAGLANGTDWAASVELDASALDAATRALLAQGWCQLGALEHASVAAFARFTLQLLGLGAPHALVVESNRALCDETEHAQLCFGLAAAFGSTTPGPGPLDSRGALARSGLAEVALDTFIEGCIGETVATLEACEALAHAAFPEVRRVLERIYADEARHAALAWRFVAWAATQAPELTATLRRRLGLELERAARARAASSPQATPAHAGLAAGGLLSASARAELRVRALAEVVEPCLVALEQQALVGELATDGHSSSRCSRSQAHSWLEDDSCVATSTCSPS